MFLSFGKMAQAMTIFSNETQGWSQAQHTTMEIEYKMPPNICWLVVWTPLKNMTSSVGMMTFPTEWKHKKSSKPSTSIMFIDDFYCCDCWSKYIRLRNEIHISLCSHHPSSLRCVAGHGQIVMRHGPTPGSRTPAVQWKRILNWAIHNCRLYKPHE